MVILRFIVVIVYGVWLSNFDNSDCNDDTTWGYNYGYCTELDSCYSYTSSSCGPYTIYSSYSGDYYNYYQCYSYGYYSGYYSSCTSSTLYYNPYYSEPYEGFLFIFN